MSRFKGNIFILVGMGMKIKKCLSTIKKFLSLSRELSDEEYEVMSDCLTKVVDLGRGDEILSLLENAPNQGVAGDIGEEVHELSHTICDVLRDTEGNLYDISAFGIYFAISVKDKRWEEKIKTEEFELPDIDALTKLFRKHLPLNETTSVVLMNKIIHPQFFEAITVPQWKSALKSASFFHNVSPTVTLPKNDFTPPENIWGEESLFVFVRGMLGFIIYENLDEYDRVFLPESYGTLFESMEQILKSNLEEIAPVESVSIVPEIVPAHNMNTLINDLVERLTTTVNVAKGTLKLHAFYTFRNWYERFSDSLKDKPTDKVRDLYCAFLGRWYDSVQADINSGQAVRIVYADTSAMKQLIEESADPHRGEVDESQWREAALTMAEIREPVVEPLLAHDSVVEDNIACGLCATVACYRYGDGDNTLSHVIATVHYNTGKPMGAYVCWNTLLDLNMCMDALFAKVQKHKVTSIFTVEKNVYMEICSHCMNVVGRVAEYEKKQYNVKTEYLRKIW